MSGPSDPRNEDPTSTPSVGAAPGAGAAPSGDVAILLKQRSAALASLAAAQSQIAAGQFDITDPGNANAYKTLLTQAAGITDDLLHRKLDPNTGAAIADSDAALARGNLNARLAELGITSEHYRRQDNATDEQNKIATDRNRIQEENDKRVNDREVRQTNIDAILKDLEGKVQTGELNRKSALDKANTQIAAADQARQVYREQGGKALPAGTQFFPGLEPGSTAANAVKALGFSFPGMATGGTYQIDPNAFAQPAMDAINAPNPSIDAATLAAANASRLLAGLGVPMGGR